MCLWLRENARRVRKQLPAEIASNTVQVKSDDCSGLSSLPTSKLTTPESTIIVNDTASSANKNNADVRYVSTELVSSLLSSLFFF